MAPNFLSKFVKSSSPSDHHRSRTSSSSRSSFATPSQSPAAKPAISAPPAGPGPAPRGDESSDSSSPHVTVIPPSPHTSDLSVGDQRSNTSAVNVSGESTSTPRRVHSLSVGSQPALSPQSPSPSSEEDPMTPTPWSRPNAPERNDTVRPLSSANSTGSLRSKAKEDTTGTHLEEPKQRKRTISQKSSRSALRIKVDKNGSPTASHERAATVPISAASNSSEAGEAEASITITPIVESPTMINTPSMDSALTKSTISSSSTMPISTNSSLLGPPDSSDTISVYSASGAKKRGWRRSSMKEKEAITPTLTTSSTFSSIATSPGSKSKRRGNSTAGGLASALAASGLAMANPAAIMQPINASDSVSTTRATRSSSITSGTISPDNTSPTHHRRQRSNDVPPKTPHSRTSRSRQTSISYATSDISDRASFYSGVEGEDVSSGSEGSDDLDLDADDIPVTGFAVASARRNQEFHELFSNVPEGDYLIEDYGCALQREILVQGRLYISENHVCFHANIFGWVTDLTIPMHDVVSLEKRMTAFVIPNAIQITTHTAKYTFTSFLSRDTTFDVMYNVWRLARPEGDSASALGSASILSGDLVLDSNGGINGVGVHGKPKTTNGIAVAVLANKVTQCACGKAGQHFSETAMDCVFPGTPEKIYNLMFTSGFIKDFMRNDQKLIDIQISDWMPLTDNAALLFRNMSYIKPLNASIGPKQTKCELRDEMVHCDFDDYVVMMTTTRTPEVPSGSVFSVKTRACFTWASSISTRVFVSTQVEWTGRSFIKGIIEKSCIDGQKTYHIDLEKAMRDYIHQHQSEFVPEGLDVAAVEEAEAQIEAPKTPVVGEKPPLSEEEARKLREKERDLRGLQWAYDTFAGAFKVAQQSTEGALELIRDAWDQSSPSTILYFIIVILVISNLWTLAMMGKREEVGRVKEMRRTEEREKWVQGIVTALWDELNVNKVPVAGGPPILQSTSTATNWREEVVELTSALDAVEERLNRLRQSLQNIES